MGLLKTVRGIKQDLVLTIAIAIMFASRLVTFIAFPNPVSAPDSSTYYSGHFLNFDLVSFTGHAARGWVVPALYSLMPNTILLEFTQLGFSLLVWTFLLITVKNSKILNSTLTKYLLIILAVLGSSPQVIQHDTAILATSISNSLYVLLVALLLQLKIKRTNLRQTLFSLLFIGSLLSIQKTTFLPVVGTLILLGLWSVKKDISLHAKRIFIAITILSGFLIVSIGANINNSWQVSYSGQTLLWQLGGQSPIAEDFGRYLVQKNAPKCVTDGVPYSNLDVSIGKVLNECPSGSRFVKSSIQREFLFFALSHPVATSKLAIFGIGASITDSASNYGNAVSILPKATPEIFFGGSSPDIVNSNLVSQVEGMNFLNSGRALWLFTPLILWILCGVFGSFLSHSRNSENSYLLIIVCANLVQAALVVVLLPSEWVRQTSPFILGALIVSVILSLKLIETIFEKQSSLDT